MKRQKLICGILLFTLLFSFTGCGTAQTADDIERPASPTSYTNTMPTTESPTVYVEKEKVYEDYYDNEYPDYYYPNTSGEKYSNIVENGFSSVALSPLSTFGADVDTASYSNFRRFVEDGYGLYNIPSDAIRVEEMINYFTYNYKEPKKGEVFGVNATISSCPWNPETNLLSLGINTKSMKDREIPPCNVVFLIDVSGSMSSHNKLPLIKEAMEMAIENFDGDDRISIVTYASGVSIVKDGIHGDNHKEIINAFDSLYASGSTFGEAGLETAYEVADSNFIEDGVNRIIICSDGDFNVGASSQSELYKLISEKRDSGIFLSTLGFGMGNYSDTTMETLADNGNGNYAYIDSLDEAKKVLVDEMTANLVTVAKDVKLQVEFNPATVSEYRLVGYENRALDARDFTDDKKDGGELGAGHQVTVLYEVKLANGTDPYSNLKYQSKEDNTELSKKGEIADEYCTLSIAYKDPDADKSNYLEYPINVDNYTERPDEDFIFASMVATTAMAARNSEYLESCTPDEALNEVVNTLRKLDLDDEYKEDFYYLVKLLKRN